jgi:hypothetical protein
MPTQADRAFNHSRVAMREMLRQKDEDLKRRTELHTRTIQNLSREKQNASPNPTNARTRETDQETPGQNMLKQILLNAAATIAEQKRVRDATRQLAKELGWKENVRVQVEKAFLCLSPSQTDMARGLE